MSLALPIPLRRALGWSFAVAVCAKVLALIWAVVLARQFGPAGYGLFTFATGAALLGGRLATLGFPTLMNRFLPAYQGSKEFGPLNGLLRLSDRVVPVMGCLAGGAVAGSTLYLGPAHPLSPGLILAGGLLPLMALRAVTRAQLGALGTPGRGLSVDELLPPLGALLLLPLMTSPSHAVLGYGAACAGAVGLGLLWRGPHVPRATPVFDTRLWLAVALPALIGMSAKLFLSKTDILMLAPLAGLEPVGQYGAALRLTYVQTTPMVVLATALTPALSAALSAGDLIRARQLYHLGLAAALVCSAPFAALFSFAPLPVLDLILGAAYRPAAPVLAVLGLAQMAAAVGIVTSAVLLMGGRERIFGALTLGALAGNVGLNLILIPAFGALGAALATLAATCLLGLAQAGIAPLILRGRDA
jgi:O-antigen/teichoic acid export membrane protein